MSSRVLLLQSGGMPVRQKNDLQGEHSLARKTPFLHVLRYWLGLICWSGRSFVPVGGGPGTAMGRKLGVVGSSDAAYVF